MARYLIVQRGPEIGKRYDLKNNVITVGRSDDNDIMLDDPYVSRYHAVFKVLGDNLTLVDLGSENPVLIKDTPLEAGTPYVLVHRDIVRIGQNVFSYQDSASAPLRPMVEPEKKSADPAIAPGSMTGSTPAMEAPVAQPSVPVAAPEPPVVAPTPTPPPTPAYEDAGATVVGVNLRDMYTKSNTATVAEFPVPSTPESFSSAPVAEVPGEATPAATFTPAPSFTPPQDGSEATVIGFNAPAPTNSWQAQSSTPPADDLEITYIAGAAPKTAETPAVHEEQETAPTGSQPVPQDQQYNYGQSNYGQYQQPADPNQPQYNYGQYQQPADPNQPQYNYGQYNYGQPPQYDPNQPQYNYGQYQQPADPNQPQQYGQYDPNQPQYNYGQYNYGQYQQPADPNQPPQYGYNQYDPNQPQYGQYGQYQPPYDPNNPQAYQQPSDPNQPQYGQYGQYYQQYGQQQGQPAYQGYQYGQYQANPDVNTVQNAAENADPTQVADYAAKLKNQQGTAQQPAAKDKEEKKETKPEEYDPDNAPTMVIRIDKTKQ
jgi:Inner membrane component of T3SS, cytoplasmic domain